MRKFDLSLRSSRSSYFATFRHQLTILSKTDALDEEKWLNMLGTFVKDWFRYESHFVHGRRSEERFSRNAETDLVCRLLLEKKKRTWSGARLSFCNIIRAAMSYLSMPPECASLLQHMTRNSASQKP